MSIHEFRYGYTHPSFEDVQADIVEGRRLQAQALREFGIHLWDTLRHLFGADHGTAHSVR